MSLRSACRWLFSLVFLAAPSFAQNWTTGGTSTLSDNFEQIESTYEWGGTATDSGFIDVSTCEELHWGFDPSLFDASEHATFHFQTCPNNTQSGACRAVSGIVSTPQSGSTLSAGPYARIDVVAPTQGGDTARVTLDCVRNIGRGPGGGGGDWFSTALTLADPNMSSAINQATYEWHHWSMKDIRPEPFVLLDFNNWAFFDSVCTPGTAAGIIQFIYDTNACTAGGGGGSSGNVCLCGDSGGVAYVVQGAGSRGQASHYWVAAYTAIGGEGVGGYSTDVGLVGYPKQLLRLDFPTANTCATAEEVNYPVTFQPRDNPVFYVEATPWNYDTQLPNITANLADSIVFLGWKRDDISVSTPGFNHYIDPAVAGTNALIEADLVDAFGFMWVDSKWYMVFVKNSVIVSADLILDPVAKYGSIANYTAQHTGGSIALVMQTDIDQKSGGRRKGAYQVTNTVDSTNFHSAFVPFSISASNAGPDSGYQDGAGTGENWHRVVTGCLENGSTATFGRFFLSQMDVIK